MLGKLATSLDMNVEAEARAEDKQWFSGRTGVPCESDSHEKVTPTGYPLHRENRENGQKNPCQGKHREFGLLELYIPCF